MEAERQKESVYLAAAYFAEPFCAPEPDFQSNYFDSDAMIKS